MIIYNFWFEVQVFARIKALVTKPETLQTGISASDAAMTLGIAPAMAKEHLLTAESKGMVLCNFLRRSPIFLGSNMYLNIWQVFFAEISALTAFAFTSICFLK